jgi:hypothetical protein
LWVRSPSGCWEPAVLCTSYKYACRCEYIGGGALCLAKNAIWFDEATKVEPADFTNGEASIAREMERRWPAYS